MSEKPRIAKWDNVKYFLILCVVAGHMINSYKEGSHSIRSLYYFIYMFHMPAFIFISGLFSNETIEKKKYDRIFGFLVLFFVIKILIFAALHFSEARTNIRFMNMVRPEWYAFALFVYYLATIFLKRFSKNWVLTAAIVLSCFLGFDNNFNDFFALSRIVVFFPFFLMGFYCNPGQLLKFSEKRWTKCCALLILVVTALLVWCKLNDLPFLLTIWKGKAPYRELGALRLYGPLLRLGYYASGMLLTLCVIVIIPSISCFFTKLGSRTLTIYALHYSLMTILFNTFHLEQILQRIAPGYFKVLLLFIAFLVTILLGMKPLDQLLKRIVFPKTLHEKEEISQTDTP